MFTTVYNLERLINNDIQYLTEAIASGKADDDYIENMEYMIDRRLKRLKEISNNQRLIDKCTRKAYEAFDEAKRGVIYGK